MTPARRLEVRVVLGAPPLDLREAVLPPGGCELALSCVLGTLRVLVAPGTAVDDAVAPVVGTVRNHADHDGQLPVARVRLTGTAVMSEVGVRVAPPGEPAAAAWKRAKPNRRRA